MTRDPKYTITWYENPKIIKYCLVCTWYTHENLKLIRLWARENILAFIYGFLKLRTICIPVSVSALLRNPEM